MNGWWELDKKDDSFKPQLTFRKNTPESWYTVWKELKEWDISTSIIELHSGEWIDINLIPVWWSRGYLSGFYRWKWGYWYLMHNENKERVAIFRKEEVTSFWPYLVWVHEVPQVNPFDISETWYLKRWFLYSEGWEIPNKRSHRVSNTSSRRKYSSRKK